MGGRADLTCGTSGIWEGGLTSHVVFLSHTYCLLTKALSDGQQFLCF